MGKTLHLHLWAYLRLASIRLWHTLSEHDKSYNLKWMQQEHLKRNPYICSTHITSWNIHCPSDAVCTRHKRIQENKVQNQNGQLIFLNNSFYMVFFALLLYSFYLLPVCSYRNGWAWSLLFYCILHFRKKNSCSLLSVLLCMFSVRIICDWAQTWQYLYYVLLSAPFSPVSCRFLLSSIYPWYYLVYGPPFFR